MIHLDRYFWKPGWVVTEREIWREEVKELVAGDRWIIDGNYDGSLDIRIPPCDTIIHFLISRPGYALWRIFKRVVTTYNKVRDDLGEGCPEHFDWEFTKWVSSFNRKIRPRITSYVEMYKNEKEIIVLNNPSEVESFLNNFRRK